MSERAQRVEQTMIDDDREQELVAAVLRQTPPARVGADFVARVNARIDETAGWLALADFRAWTLGLVPAAAALLIVAILWPASSNATHAPVTAPSAPTPAQTFSPASYADWQQDVNANALLEAALKAPGSGNR